MEIENVHCADNYLTLCQVYCVLGDSGWSDCDLPVRGGGEQTAYPGAGRCKTNHVMFIFENPMFQGFPLSDLQVGCGLEGQPYRHPDPGICWMLRS